MARALWIACNALVALFVAGPIFAADEVVGAGSSFTALVMQAWTSKFEAEHKVPVHYRSVGSGEGIRRVTANSVDFAVTDIPLTQAELVQADLIQFPLVVGAIVPVVNLPHITPGELHLSGAVMGDLFLGKIVNWNDPGIRSLNPGLELPDLPVSVIHRADGSGTTFVFTHYLSKTNAEWQDRLGVGSRLNWPAGKGAKGNEGITLEVQETIGAIGYVEYTYAVNNRLTTAKLVNRAGKLVAAGEGSIRAALASTTWARPSYYEVVTDRAGDDSWPIVGVSFVLIRKNQENLEDARETLGFIDWIYRSGGAAAIDNHYVPLDEKSLIKRIESGWKDIKDNSGQTVWRPEPK